MTRTASSSDPAYVLQLRGQAYEHARVGVLLAPRPKLGQVTTDPATDARSAAATAADAGASVEGSCSMPGSPSNSRASCGLAW